MIADNIIFNDLKSSLTLNIVSDSHTRYVSKIAAGIFQCDFVSLTDKPNVHKVKEYLLKKHVELNTHFPHPIKDRNEFMVIGDTWLDIEMGRALNFATVLAKFYKAVPTDVRDGIGLETIKKRANLSR